MPSIDALMGNLTGEIEETMKRYWHLRNIYHFSAEEIRIIRLHILFGDDLTGKLVLPENSVYSSNSLEDTCYHLGAVTKPITKDLSELSSAYQIEGKSNANKH